jgi:hypothetical protein
MHCPTCNKTLAAGTKCPKCGKMAVASSADEIDLMPLEPARPADPAAYAPPPDAFMPPPPPMPGTGKKAAVTAEPGEAPPMEEPLRPRAGAMAPRAGNTNLIIGAVVVGILVLFFAWRIFRTEDKVLGRLPIENKAYTIQPNQAQVENYEVTGKIGWKFEVTPTEDTVLMGVVVRNPADAKTVVALKKLNEVYDPVKKGEMHPMSGEFKTGKYSWVIMNETKKPVRVKVTFKAQPQ